MEQMRDKHVINGYVFFSVNVMEVYYFRRSSLMEKKKSRKEKAIIIKKQGCWL